MYVGDGYVIDVIGNDAPTATSEGEDGLSDHARRDGRGISDSIPNSFAEGLSAALFGVDTHVRKSKTLAVARGRTFFRNNRLDSEYPPLPVDEICARAESLVGSKWDYKLLSSNCEHFASEMRYNTPISLQTCAFEELADDPRLEDFVSEARDAVRSYVAEGAPLVEEACQAATLLVEEAGEAVRDYMAEGSPVVGEAGEAVLGYMAEGARGLGRFLFGESPTSYRTRR